MSRIIASVLIAAAPLLAAGAAPALAQSPAQQQARPREARIPFLSSVRDWREDGDRGIWIQDRNRRWYYGRFFGPCTDLPWATGVRFDTRGYPGIDRTTVVRVGRDRCPLASFTESAPPPPKAKKPKKTTRR